MFIPFLRLRVLSRSYQTCQDSGETRSVLRVTQLYISLLFFVQGTHVLFYHRLSPYKTSKSFYRKSHVVILIYSSESSLINTSTSSGGSLGVSGNPFLSGMFCTELTPFTRVAWSWTARVLPAPAGSCQMFTICPGMSGRRHFLERGVEIAHTCRCPV